MSVDPSRLPPDRFDPRGDALEPPYALQFQTGDGLVTPPAVRRPRSRAWLHLLLFLATVASTTAWGMLHYAGFVPDFDPGQASMPAWILSGFWYSATVLAILGCHELGHYAACRYYRVDASPPYFLPAPILLTGTLGAFIRIREPIRTKRVLFDIGVAGPIAGFVVAVPALWAGIALSRIVPDQPDFSGFSLGEPLLFKAFAWLIWGDAPEGHTMLLHPMAFAAWFGLIATALNLFPVGQLDGGHITYAVLGRWSTFVTLLAVFAAIVMSFFSSSLIVWTALLVIMILMFGPRHPRTEDEDVPIGRPRLVVAAIALVIFAVCFTPVPIEIARLFPA